MYQWFKKVFLSSQSVAKKWVLPILSTSVELDPHYKAFYEAVLASSFSGELSTAFSQRFSLSRDNSPYQCCPQLLCFPKTEADIQIICSLLSQPEFSSIVLTARAGGTSCNGQSLGAGVIMDCSKFMTEILEINTKDGYVRVQPGVILDDLNDHLKARGYFFAPHVSPSSRACIGGMIGTDACGEGSRLYGRTGDHLLEARVVLSEGSLLSLTETDSSLLEDSSDSSSSILSTIIDTVSSVLKTHSEAIQKTYPDMTRYLTGYNLKKSLDAIDLNSESPLPLLPLIAGSEGTLGIISEAKLRVTPMPKVVMGMVLAYTSFQEALEEATNLSELTPTAIESLDDSLLALCRENQLFSSVLASCPELKSTEVQAISLLAFTGSTQKGLKERMGQVKSRSQALHVYTFEKFEKMQVFWELRKKAVGVLGNVKTDEVPLPFIEDTAVPPEKMPAYIKELTALLSKEGVPFVCYGHADAGCVHVRPKLSLRDPRLHEQLRRITDQVFLLVSSFGGVMWGEHGRGYRSNYGPKVFGHDLYQGLRQIKEAFDPKNQLNPGKVATPFSFPDKLKDVGDDLQTAYMEGISDDSYEAYRQILNCNGNGACFQADATQLMCPSYLATNDRLHSPKGRAVLFKEWLRQCGLAGIHLGNAQKQGRGGFKKQGWFKRLLNTLHLKEGKSDLTHDLKVAMHGCLHCKACVTQCPVEVSIPDVIPHVYDAYYTRYLRPLRDFLILRSEFFLYWVSQKKYLKKVMSWIGTQSWMNTLSKETIGLTSFPVPGVMMVSKELKKRRHLPFSFEFIKSMSYHRKKRAVILLQDAFTLYYRPEVFIAYYDLLIAMGKDVIIPPFMSSGKPSLVLGDLKRYSNCRQRLCSFLTELTATFGEYEVPILGIEPSLSLMFRDEYQKITGDDKTEVSVPQVLLPQEYLLTQVDSLKTVCDTEASSTETIQRELMVLPHCHEQSLSHKIQGSWETLFSLLGIKTQVHSVGCCGMAGVYAHQKEHEETGRALFALSWQQALSSKETSASSIPLCTGASCYHHSLKEDGRALDHPLLCLGFLKSENK